VADCETYQSEVPLKLNGFDLFYVLSLSCKGSFSVPYSAKFQCNAQRFFFFSFETSKKMLLED
jgi:hypothetical protein